MWVYHLTMLIMPNEEITQDKLYEFLKQQFGYINRRFDYLDNRVESIERRLEKVEDKVDRLYETRDKIKLEFNRRVLLGNSFLAGIVAFIIAMFTGKYKPY